MKVTRYSGPRLGTLVASIGGDPTAPSGSDPAPDCCDVAADPVDRAIDAAAVRLSAAGAVTLIQSTFDGTGGDSGIFSASYDSAPTAGNILIIIMGGRADPYPLNVPSGFTSLVQNTFAGVDSYNHRIVAKVSDGTETTITFDNTSNGAPETIIMSEWGGFGGVLPTVDASATSDVTDDATPAIPAITPTSSISALLIASVWKKAAGPNPGPSTLSGYTLLDDSAYIGLGNRHRLTAWYQVVASTSGTYGPTDISSTGDGTDDSNVIHFATETSPDEAAWVIPSPNVTDDDDATYDTVTSNTDLLRIDLGAPFRITSTRIRIAANTSGARTFTIKGANAVDFSDEVTLATIAFTATGSYTAQDVTGSWSTTASYQYFELSIGTSDTYRIHAWELLEGSLAGDVTVISDALDAHLADMVDAHDASAVSIVDAGGYFTGTDVEAALQELGAGTAGGFVTVNEGGGETLSTVAAAGATETIDLTDGNVHDVTLTADCTFTFAAVASGAARSFTLVLRQDGTGGWDPTWPGSVVWAGGAAPTLDTTASSVSVLTFFTLDGGTVWYGFSTGGGGTPATTVEAETTFGISSAVGTDTEYARQDHTHGTPANPVTEATIRDIGHWELVMEDGVTAPPVPVTNEAEDDWLYAWVSG